MRFIYTILFYIALPFMFLRLLWRSRKAPDYRKRWAERIGLCPHRLSQCIWIHAVSLGETIAAVPLIRALQKLYPKTEILLTNMTPTGSARVNALFGDAVYNAYLPYDLPLALELFIKRVNPQVLIIMETELWPNVIAVCEKHEIGVFVMNARLSEKSAQGYRRVLPLTRTMFPGIKRLAVQSQMDADRFIALGYPSEKIRVTGSLKFDLEIPDDLTEKSGKLRAELGSDRLIWIAASTHRGEDEIVLQAHREILKEVPQALLILVPRHPERFNAVAELVQQQGFTMARRSKGELPTAETQVYLGDTLGEMLLLYSVADVAFVAGSFVPVGGHNMVEPAALHKPIVTGPHLFNFAEISGMLSQANGLVKVADAAGLANEVSKLLLDETYRQTVGENAFQIAEKNRGALKRQLEVIRTCSW